MSRKDEAKASIDVANDSDGEVHSVVLRYNIRESDVLRLVDTKWYASLGRLTSKHGGASFNATELRAGYDPNASSHYNEVLKLLREKFTFNDPR